MQIEIGKSGKLIIVFSLGIIFVCCIWQWEQVTDALQNNWPFALAFPEWQIYEYDYWFWHATFMTIAAFCYFATAFMLIVEIVKGS